MFDTVAVDHEERQHLVPKHQSRRSAVVAAAQTLVVAHVLFHRERANATEGHRVMMTEEANKS